MATSALFVDIVSVLPWLFSADKDEPAAVMIGALELFRFAMRSRTDISKWKLKGSAPFPGSLQQIRQVKSSVLTYTHELDRVRCDYTLSARLLIDIDIDHMPQLQLCV